MILRNNMSSVFNRMHGSVQPAASARDTCAYFFLESSVLQGGGAGCGLVPPTASSADIGVVEALQTLLPGVLACLSVTDCTSLAQA